MEEITSMVHRDTFWQPMKEIWLTVCIQKNGERLKKENQEALNAIHAKYPDIWALSRNSEVRFRRGLEIRIWKQRIKEVSEWRHKVRFLFYRIKAYLLFHW